MDIKAITSTEHAEIVATSEILDSINHAGMLVHQLQHPELGKAILVQGTDGAILINMPE